jgi:hypothetical protein
MWRVGLLSAVFLGFAIAAPQAAHLKRASCVEQDFALCNLDRSAPGYSAQKPPRSHTQRAGTKSRTGKDAASSVGYARAAASPDAKPLAPTAPVQMLGARNFDPLAGGSEELTAPRVQSETNPWLQPILLVLAGTGILSLFVAKAAEL